jgi:hypothetical protein
MVICCRLYVRVGVGMGQASPSLALKLARKRQVQIWPIKGSRLELLLRAGLGLTSAQLEAQTFTYIIYMYYI